MLKNINENKKKLYEIDKTDYIIQPMSRLVTLIHTIKLILDFNDTIQLDLVWKI